MTDEIHGSLDGAGLRIGIVVANFNEFITSRLLQGAKDALAAHGVRDDDVTVASVPGSFEIPLVAKKLAETGRYDVIVCLGCVIRGETDHYDHVVEQTARGLQEVGTRTGVPCISGVVTAETLEQAINRAGAKMGNQGATAMMAGIEMANLIKKVGHPRGKA